MRAIILAQGDGRRWEVDGKPYLGRPKQLVKIGGEAIVHRAARVFAERGCDVVVVAPDDRFVAGHGRLHTLDDPWPVPNDLSKFYATRPLWSDTERTAILWGDCWYSDAAADAIVGHPDDALHYFRRPGASTTTGHQWDESFAVTFGPGEHARVLEVTDRVHAAWTAGQLRKREGTHLPIRNHYAAALGVPYDKRRLLLSTPGQTVINDWTDDIDSPYDFANWVGRHQAGRINVAVCIPWFGGTPARERAWAHVHKHFEQLGVPVYVGDDDTGGQWTNRARGCNNAARQAIADGAKVLLIGDADTIIPGQSLWAAAAAAEMTGQLIVAYSEYVKLSQRATRRVLAGGDPSKRAHGEKAPTRWHKHVSGGVAVTADLFEHVGGFDERFQSYGGEDRAFWMACFTLADGWHRIDGNAWHLWHPPSPERDCDNYAAVLELGHRYKRASGWLTSGGLLGSLADHDTEPDRDALLQLMSEPGGPLHNREAMTHA